MKHYKHFNDLVIIDDDAATIGTIIENAYDRTARNLVNRTCEIHPNFFTHAIEATANDVKEITARTVSALAKPKRKR